MVDIKRGNMPRCMLFGNMQPMRGRLFHYRLPRQRVRSKLKSDDLGWCPFTGFEVKQVLALLSRTYGATTISLIHSEEGAVRRQHELALCKT